MNTLGRNWTEEQQNAIKATGGAILVSAAAGSGKTSVLVQRIIEQIVNPKNKINIDDFLIVTFTKAAAQEMKNRIFVELSNIALKNPNDANVQRQLMRLKYANIGTIHSFCSKMVKENFYKLGISPNFKIIEDEQAFEYKELAIKNTFNYFYSLNDKKFEKVLDVLSKDKNDLSLKKIIFQIYNFVSSLAFPEKWMDERNKDMESAIKDIKSSKHVKTILENTKEKLEFAKHLNSEILEIANRDEDIKKSSLEVLESDRQVIEKIISVLESEKSSWDDIANSINSASFETFVSTKNKEKAHLNKIVKGKRDYVKKIINGLSKFFSFAQDEIVEHFKEIYDLQKTLFSIVEYFSKEYSTLKTAKNVLEFCDLERFALKLLCEYSDDKVVKSKTANDISEKFQEIVIDEYQDINELQDMIFKLVSKDGKNIFAVGDIKQCIYSFRNSNPKIFSEKKDSYEIYNPNKEKYPAKIILSKNFRSKSGIINFVNYIFENIMSKKVGEVDYDSEEKLNAGANYSEIFDKDDADVVFKMIDVDKQDGLKSEACEISKLITKMIAEGYQIYENGKLRAVTYNDFCILLRSANKNCNIYSQEFLENGIPFWSENKENFLKTSEISTILSILQVVNNPLQDISLISSMLTPIFGFNIDEISGIRYIDINVPLYFAIKKSAEAGNVKSKIFIEKIDLYRKMSNTMPCNEFIDYIYSETDYPAIVLSQKNGNVKKSNLIAFSEHAKKYEKQYKGGLSGFLKFIDTLKNSDLDLSPANRSSKNENTVKIMSIHKSKGLEFPICILAGCSKKFVNDTDSLMINKDLGVGMKLKSIDGTLKIDNIVRKSVVLKNSIQDLSEELRVLYVALTRAKQKLIIVSSDENILEKVDKKISLLNGFSKISSSIVRDSKSFLDLFSLCFSKSNIENFIDIFSGIGSGAHLRKIRLNLDKNCSIDLEYINSCFQNENIQNKNSNLISDTHEKIHELRLNINQKNIYQNIKKRLEFKYPFKDFSSVPMRVSASIVSHLDNIGNFIANSKPSFLYKNSTSGVDVGNATHKFMYYANFEKISKYGVKKEIDFLYNGGFLNKSEYHALCIQSLENFVNSNLFDRILNSEKVIREHRFSVKITPEFLSNDFDFKNVKETENKDFIVLQGAIDCAFLENDKYVLVDYKTDRISDISELFYKYNKQVELYKYALKTSENIDVKETILYSFSLGDSYSF